MKCVSAHLTGHEVVRRMIEISDKPTSGKMYVLILAIQPLLFRNSE